MATIRANAAHGQTAFGWGDHSKAGYVKPFVITLTTGSGTTEDPYKVDKSVEDVLNAINSKSLIYLLEPDANNLYPAIYMFHGSTDVMIYFGVTWADDNALWAFLLNTNASSELVVERYDFSYAIVSQIATINGNNLVNGGEDIKVGVPSIQAGTGTNAEVFNGGAPNSAGGIRAHAEGVGAATGENSHAEGIGFASGKNSHAEGDNTLAYRENSHAEGMYNAVDIAAIHSVGIGTESVRKDAHRITYDGKHYIIGIGGFDGTKATANLTNEKDLATVINGYETRIAALETALAGIKSN